MPDKPVILLVGHCGPDAWALTSAVRSALPDTDVRQVDDDAALRDSLDAARLLLVNRVLDGDFQAAGGIELIESLASDGAPGMMLISNFEEAQAAAQDAGALPGFGKTQLYDPATRDRLVQALQP